MNKKQVKKILNFYIAVSIIMIISPLFNVATVLFSLLAFGSTTCWAFFRSMEGRVDSEDLVLWNKKKAKTKDYIDFGLYLTTITFIAMSLVTMLIEIF
ncbi:gp504 [Bacillus phage G]|uniref:Gp504 n=1 Tax=Bacillus phage G TaxID=2884420 RepID=G3MAP5_9CAUD|nr:gp504 [Bacillus phage G]AEO93762.1 gp504 [Bacillus phage G]